MVKKLFFILTTLILLKVSTSQAETHGKFHGYVAFGTAFGLGAVRLGTENLEGGYLTSKMVGVSKIFDINDRYYSAFGLGVGPGGLGAYAGMGAYYHVWFFSTRAELAMQMDSGGYGFGTGLAGLAFGF